MHQGCTPRPAPGKMAAPAPKNFKTAPPDPVHPENDPSLTGIPPALPRGFNSLHPAPPRPVPNFFFSAPPRLEAKKGCPVHPWNAPIA